MEGTGQKQEFQNNPPSQTAEVIQPNHGIPSPQLGTRDKERENIRIQKAEWIYSQIQKQREAEDELFAQLRQEQDVLDNLCQSIENNMERTKEARRYNQEFQEHIDTQVYAMYGITEDKLQGIREYRNAYYQGCAFSLFLLSVVLVALCGFLHGFGSQICLFMIAFSGIEGALLAQGKQRGKALDLLCKALYLLMFPLMMAVFVCFELGYPEYRIMLPILAIFGICVLVLGTAAYFFYNPYRNEKKKASVAKDTIREIEKTARKEVRKNQKSREKSEKKQQKLLGRKAAKQQKQLEKEEKQQQKRLEKEEKQQQKLLEKEEKQQQKLLDKEKKQQQKLLGTEKGQQEPSETEKSRQKPLETEKGQQGPSETWNGQQEPSETWNGQQEPLEAENGQQEPLEAEKDHQK